MAPSGLVSVVIFLVIAPTALIVRIFTLLNINAVLALFQGSVPRDYSLPVTFLGTSR